ncbi:hypothetical protein LUZ63_016644 [Rhynchospora breviuscula]|uniref:Protein kinase domain-containing protein n=1 Tax=Rhynchospora breviuscula TaxID=2022672 RepID=A0A9P9ZA98_9POAL|nr:hypothetical protein LUZ63_016644 [Rhynchospora breviuscula]
MVRLFPFSLLKIIVLLSLIRHLTSVSFTFPYFNQSSQGILYQGDAGFSDNSIHLTKSQHNSFGRAVYYQAIPIWDPTSNNITDFTTSFTFIVDGSNCLEGLAFFLAPYPSMLPTNPDGTYLALFNGSMDTIQPSQIIAVEFDCSGVDNPVVHSDINNFSVTTVSLDASVIQGIIAFAVIQYSHSNRNFSVSLSYPDSTTGAQNWSISHAFDLQETLPSEITIGFSSLTNNATQSHRILSWDFTPTLEKPQPKVAAKANDSNLDVVNSQPPIDQGKKNDTNPTLDKSQHRVEGKRIRIALGIGLSVAIVVLLACPRKFTNAQLRYATDNFSDGRKLGRGASGQVYRGILTEPSITMAVKRIERTKRGKKEYISEVTIISKIQHRNLVKLFGFCHDDKDLLLVYEFMSNGSLDTHLYITNSVLQWSIRYKIVIGIASALLYLHEQCEKCVLHRDIKPSNIMLDSDFNPKLGDFGVARLMNHADVMLDTRHVCGTTGYIAPEYIVSGIASKKSDVFSFGVVILEIICGRKPIENTPNEETAHLVKWVWDHYGRGASIAVVDHRLYLNAEEKNCVERMIAVGLWCAHPNCNRRPSISKAFNALNFDEDVPDLPEEMPVPTYHQPNNEMVDLDLPAGNCSNASVTKSEVYPR